MSNQDQVREAAAREWRCNPSLHAEFSSEHAFVAYRAAMARGAARVFAPSAPVRTFKNPGSSSGDVAAGAASVATPRGMNVVRGVAMAREDCEHIRSIVREFQKDRAPGAYRYDEIVGFVAARSGLDRSMAAYALEQSCLWSRPVVD